MSAISVGLNGLEIAVTRERNAIEARLALGATRFEALGVPIRGAVRAGLIPILNQMAAAGLVTLPGMMTGQILAGADPRGAATLPDPDAVPARRGGPAGHGRGGLWRGLAPHRRPPPPPAGPARTAAAALTLIATSVRISSVRAVSIWAP